MFLLVTSTAFAGNIGRNVYGALCESLSGVTFSKNLDDSVDFFFWGNMQGGGSSEERTDGPKEGLKYTRLFLSNASYWGGCGITFINSSNQEALRDMSAYYNGELRFSVKINNNVNYEKFKVGIKINSTNIVFPLSSFSGFDPNKLNQWQDVSLKLNSTTHAHITSTNMARTSFLFIISYDQCAQGETSANINMDVDYIRWVKPNSSGAFNVTVKNVSDNSTAGTSNIVWNSNNFQTGWAVAEQYLEVDYDNDAHNNWDVKLYVNNGSAERNGLYATTARGQEVVLPMCWRASERTLPYSDANGAHTTQIAEAYNEEGDYWFLYDAGNGDKGYVPWLYMQDLAAFKTNKDINYSTLMGYRTGGYHAYSGVYGGAPSQNGFYSGSKVDVYFGANCRNAAGGLRYTGNICVVLTYE